MSEVDTGLPPLFDSLLASATDEPIEVPEFESPDDSDDSVSRTRKPRSDKGKTRGPRGGTTTATRGRSTSDKKLADDLLNPWGKGIKAVAFAAPTLAAVMTQQAETTMTAIVSLASPKMKAALTKVSRIGPGADLVEAIAMMIVAGAMDFGRIPPASPIAIVTGVQQFYDLVHPPEQDPQFGRPSSVDHGPAADNVHPFPSTPDYPAGGSIFTSYPGVATS
jgi:hypothetical protein